MKMFLSSIFLSAFRTSPSTIPRRITNPSYGSMSHYSSAGSNGNLVLGPLRSFLSLFRLCGFAPLRKSPSGKSGHCPLPGREAVCLGRNHAPTWTHRSLLGSERVSVDFRAYLGDTAFVPVLENGGRLPNCAS